MNVQRVVRWSAWAGLALLAAGCATPPSARLLDDGRYCHRAGKGLDVTSTCTSGAIPAKALQADARTLSGAPGVLTVYVIRDRWNDASGVLRVSVAGRGSLETVPESFVRLRLPPGSHRLQLEGADAAGLIEVSGQAGEVRLVELEGEVWAWRRHLHLTAINLDGQPARVARLPLVAAVD